jgi:hypothetical protein
MVWVSDEHQGKVDAVINKCLEQLPSPQLRESFLTRLAEHIFDDTPDVPKSSDTEQYRNPKMQR